MAQPKENERLRRGGDRPIRPDTPLFRILEAIARQVAERLRTEQTPPTDTTPASPRQQSSD